MAKFMPEDLVGPGLYSYCMFFGTELLIIVAYGTLSPKPLNSKQTRTP